jgi:hypothetical protein
VFDFLPDLPLFSLQGNLSAAILNEASENLADGMPPKNAETLRVDIVLPHSLNDHC